MIHDKSDFEIICSGQTPEKQDFFAGLFRIISEKWKKGSYDTLCQKERLYFLCGTNDSVKSMEFL